MLKIIRTAFLFFSLFASAFSQTPDSTYAKWLLTPEIKRGFDYALSVAKLTYKDFTFRTDYWEIDPARIKGINTMMAQPLQLPSKQFEIGEHIRNQKLPGEIVNLAEQVEYLTEQGELFSPTTFTTIVNGVRKVIVAHVPTTYDVAIPEEERRLGKRMSKFPTVKHSENIWDLRQAYSYLLATVNKIKSFPKYDDREMEFIQNRAPKVILEDIMEESLSVEELDSIQKIEERLTQEFIPIVGKSHYTFSDYGKGVQYFFGNIALCLKLLERYLRTPVMTSKSIIWEDRNYQAVIGGPGPNHYKGDYSLIIDLGGDDTYELSRRPNFENQIIIDLGGNDKYFALEDYALACGYFGYSVLIDQTGNDLYQGKNFSVGCGFFGCGLLWDQVGNDTYIGDQFTQGAGGFGIGILKDDGGNDRYEAARASQGFGFVRGVGALLDASGSDNYFAGGKYKELLGLSGEIRYMSESQGYATGLRPDLSGGMGFLFDYDGDDSYNVDMFGQGSSYWWGLGALVDFKGNDRYLAQQYAQGAGVHMSLGCLVDSSGNDFYFSKGVSQGCGHDLGAGMLFDLSGNDNYVAADGSQAYGSANGFGILVDGQGNDGYYVKDKKNTQGVGNPRREYGSIAVFLDCGGVDHYDGNGGETRIWKPTGTMWGVGVDGNFGANDTAQVKK